MHTPHGDARYQLPWTFSTFDYREICQLLWRDCDATLRDRQGERPRRPLERRTADGAIAVETDRGTISAPLVVDALGWRRMLGQRRRLPAARRAALARPRGPPRGRAREDLEIWIDRRYVPAGYGWSFPARDELRIGIGSFDPRFHVKDTTVLLAEDLGKEPNAYQGNWIPHKLRRATEGGVFFAGDSAGHCLPLTAEGIRTALYFGIALGRELRGVVEGRQSREQAAARYAEFHDSHEWKFRWMLRVQKLIPRMPPRILGAADPADGLEALRRLVLRPLPADRAAGVRRCRSPGGSADDQEGAGQQQADAERRAAG